jgi:recombination protein RecR
MFPKSIEDLIDAYSKLPGIGRKSAQRLAFFTLKQDQNYLDMFARAIVNVKKMTKICKNCYNLSDFEICEICTNTKRANGIMCVVAEYADIYAIEKTQEFYGNYHILGGIISPLDGVYPEHLNIKKLLERLELEKVTEIILALTPNTEGEATISYLLKLLENKPIKLTRIARGVPTGTQLDLIDQVTLGRAINARNSL